MPREEVKTKQKECGREMLTKDNRTELLNKAQSLLNTNPFSLQAQAQFESIMKLLDVVDDDARYQRASKTVTDLRTENTQTRALRSEEEFLHFLQKPSQRRTYAALSEGTTPGSVIVPTGQWKHTYQKRLVSASGWLRAGATVTPTINGRPLISFMADDSANVASILAENQPLPQANPVYSAPTANAKSFATSTTLSKQFEQDVQNGSFDVSQHLADLFGSRVSRKFNSYATNDGTDGLLSKLTVGATTAGSIPTLGELADMQDQIDPSYLEADSQPVYMMSQSLRNTLLKQTATSGNLLYPEIKQGQLLGLPLVINVDMDANAGDVGVVCGSVKRAVQVQDAESVFFRSAERYAELLQVFFGFVNRIGVVLQDANAVTALKLHS